MEETYESRVCELLNKKFNVDSSMLVPENYDEELTSYKFNFDEVTLAYLFLEVEKEFKMKIGIDKVLNYEFNSINGITETIRREKSAKGA